MNKSFKGYGLWLAMPMAMSAMAQGQNAIFIKGKTFQYAVEYIAENINVMDTISLTPTGNPWRIAPDKQREIIITYNLAGQDTSIFADLPSIGWVGADTTGFVESVESCWIHPPRHNQYKILELAPFPRVDYPLEAGRTYARMFFIGAGWGEISNTQVTWHYEIIGETDGRWHITARATPKLRPNEVNTLDFEFHPTEGFDKLRYSFYEGVSIYMVRIRE